MSLKFNQSKVSLRLLKEKTISVILGEVLHYLFEILLTYEKHIFFLSPDSEEFKDKIGAYINKALAFYPEPLPERKMLFEKVFKTVENIFKSKEFENFKNLINKEKIVIYREPEGIFLKDKEFQLLRPDIIIKTPKEWIILEFKLHTPVEEQIEKYIDFLKKIVFSDKIKVYSIFFEPFKVELNFGSSHPTQLNLFENLS